MRVRCVQEMDRVLHFMTRKGLINTGVLTVKRPLLPERYSAVRLNVRIWNLKIKRKKGDLIQTLLKSNYVILAEESHRHWCGGFRVGCCETTAKFWHPGRYLPQLISSRFTAIKICCSSVPGGCAGGEGSDWWPCLGRHLSGGHRRERSSNCQRLCEQPHRLDVRTGSDWSLEWKNWSFHTAEV